MSEINNLNGQAKLTVDTHFVQKPKVQKAQIDDDSVFEKLLQHGNKSNDSDSEIDFSVLEEASKILEKPKKEDLPNIKEFEKPKTLPDVEILKSSEGGETISPDIISPKEDWTLLYTIETGMPPRESHFETLPYTIETGMPPRESHFELLSDEKKLQGDNE